MLRQAQPRRGELLLFPNFKKLYTELKEKNTDVKINGSVTKENYDDIQKNYDTGRSLGVPVHMDTYMFSSIHERNLPFEKQSRFMPEDAAAAEMKVMKVEKDLRQFAMYLEQKIAQLENAAGTTRME